MILYINSEDLCWDKLCQKTERVLINIWRPTLSRAMGCKNIESKFPLLSAIVACHSTMEHEIQSLNILKVTFLCKNFKY